MSRLSHRRHGRRDGLGTLAAPPIRTRAARAPIPFPNRRHRWCAPLSHASPSPGARPHPRRARHSRAHGEQEPERHRLAPPRHTTPSRSSAPLPSTSPRATTPPSTTAPATPSPDPRHGATATPTLRCRRPHPGPRPALPRWSSPRRAEAATSTRPHPPRRRARTSSLSATSSRASTASSPPSSFLLVRQSCSPRRASSRPRHGHQEPVTPRQR